MILRGRRSHTFIRHNLNSYNDLPIWVAVEIFDFGALSHLYEGLRAWHQDKIAKSFDLKAAFLKTWLRSLNVIRNLAAHHARLWNTSISKPASVPSEFTYLKKLGNSRSYLYFCMIKYLIERIEPSSKWGKRLEPLTNDFPVIKKRAVSLVDMGYKPS